MLAVWNLLEKEIKNQGITKDVIYLVWPIAPSYLSSNAGEGGGVAWSQPMSTAVHMGAQTNFRDLNPYLTYGFYLPRCPSAGSHQESSPCSGLAVPDAHPAPPAHQTIFFRTASVVDTEWLNRIRILLFRSFRIRVRTLLSKSGQLKIWKTLSVHNRNLSGLLKHFKDFLGKYECNQRRKDAFFNFFNF